jgi:arginyl-tRNA synthetase
MESKEEIIKILEKQTKLKKEEISNMLEAPNNSELGDFAFPCFKLSAIFKKNPVEIAKQIQKEIKPSKEIEKVEAKGPYLNFFLEKTSLATDVIKTILKEKEKFGQGKDKKKIMIEFSQPNTHKAFHVGHIRGTSLGESLVRISEFEGNEVIRANYSGDTGMHIAKWIWCYTKFHAKEKMREDEAWIASIYVDAVKRLAKDEKLQEQVDEINRKIEDKSDKKINELWTRTRRLSIDSWKSIYKELGAKFDVHYFESEVELRAKEIAQELVKRNIAKISEEATIMDLEKYGLSVWVLLRRDGTVLYSAKDLALAERKLKEYPKLDHLVILSGDEQNLHFQQLFKTLELMKVKSKESFSHIGFGMVRLPEGKMSSRTGQNILYSDFKKEVVDYAKDEIKKRFPKLSMKEIEERALKISIAAIKFSMLRQGSAKSIIFSKEEALSFEGDTGPYIQYSYARASSILRKAKEENKKADLKLKKGLIIEEKEALLIKKLAEFPAIVKNSYKNLAPSTLANYSLELAHSFSEFYHACPVINSENESFRLSLVEAFRIVLKNSLYLLGIEVMDEM